MVASGKWGSIPTRSGTLQRRHTRGSTVPPTKAVLSPFIYQAQSTCRWRYAIALRRKLRRMAAMQKHIKAGSLALKQDCFALQLQMPLRRRHAPYCCQACPSPFLHFRRRHLPQLDSASPHACQCPSQVLGESRSDLPVPKPQRLARGWQVRLVFSLPSPKLHLVMSLSAHCRLPLLVR